MEKIQLSVIFTTYNEAHNIAAALETVVNWADDILIVDSFSQDDTLAIARQYAVRIEERAYKGPSDQKNWAIPQAKHDWVLILDADERVTPGMRQEITSLLQTDPPFDAFWMGRTQFFMGKEVRYSGWQNDRIVRLIRRDRGRYNDNQVHEKIDIEGLRVGHLGTKLEHYTFKNIQHFLEKQYRYAQWSALDHTAKTGTITAFHYVLKPFFRFFKHYILKKGFLDGYVGFLISAVAAWSVFLRYVYMSETRQNQSENPHS